MRLATATQPETRPPTRRVAGSEPNKELWLGDGLCIEQKERLQSEDDERERAGLASNTGLGISHDDPPR